MEMYHVTHVTHVDERSVQPRWKEIKLCVPNDTTYDRSLKGLPVACFTTTKRRHVQFSAVLPTISPYPRSAESQGTGTRHWRIRMPFVPADYHIFLMAKAVTGRKQVQQVHLLCLSRTGWEVHFPELLRLTGFTELKEQAQYNTYFPNGEANIYPTSRMFVNVHFVHPVKIVPGIAKWDNVERMFMNHSFREIITTDYYKDTRVLLAKWVLNLVFERCPSPTLEQQLKIAECLLDLFGAIYTEARAYMYEACVPPRVTSEEDQLHVAVEDQLAHCGI